jgi:hypothetical protein
MEDPAHAGVNHSMEGLTSTGQSVKEWLGIRIGEYRARGLVREWREDDGPAVINPVGCEPNKPRFVLDSRWFNQLTDPPDIRLETLQDLRRCLEPGSLLCTVDLKDGFTHVPLAKDTIAKFAFRWEGVVYVFVALPFGSNFAPGVFQKITGAFGAFMRSLQVSLTDGELTALRRFTTAAMEDWQDMATWPPERHRVHTITIATDAAGEEAEEVCCWRRMG